MKKLLLLFALVSMTITMNAQEYQTGLGLRLGGINRGITVKHFTGSNTAIEGILGFARHSISITALWEKHYPFPTAPGLSWYWGVGGHVGFFQGDYTYGYYHANKHDYDFYNENYDNRFYLGADFILGLEYKFKDVPISLGLDVKPQIDIIPGLYTYFDGALSVRFTL
ncbi:MAG: hypothetical protein IPI10_08420 [Bacteroidetes bacterium]|nr:hypothetical protein [Bacteroidota bacterium]